MATPIQTCCLRSSLWSGAPTGTETTLPEAPSNKVYVAKPPANSTSRVAILLVHDLLGWTFTNNRLLADAYAREADATVYLPNFFGDEVIPIDDILAGRWDKIDVPGMTARNSREVREPEIVAFAKVLREKYDKVGAIGFCYGGWAVLRLAAGEFGPKEGEAGRGLVDCISMAHPSMVKEADIQGLGHVPVQVLAPEIDRVYTAELKTFTFTTLQKKGVPFDYQHFPGIEHGGLARGDESKKGEREAMVRGKDAAVAWFRQCLHDA
jgi:dienelactone hydrolase